MRVNVYSDKGTKLQSTVELPKEIFGIKPNEQALRQYVHVYQKNKRKGTAAAKTRSEVSGGGRKPWRQKGTGRARHGSIRSPIWVGGGVAHGPKPRGFESSIPKKIKDLALRSAFSSKAKEDKIFIVDKISFKEPKTSSAAKLIEKLKLEKPLIVTARPEEVVFRSFRNLPGVEITPASTVNPYAVLKAGNVVFLKEGIDALKKRLGVSKPKTTKSTVKKKVSKKSKK
ncbi:50S ribosomal protein L4 [Candidatus Saccharibacteria bacterium]|nr:50S ribosomal protein L4 [Candidatus Saccharibacteria bacterium]